MSFILLGVLNSQAAGGGATPTFDLLSTQIMTNNSTSTIEFASLPTDYKHLHVRAMVRFTNSANVNNLAFRINNDSGTVYTEHYARGSGSSISGNGGSETNRGVVGSAPAVLQDSGIFGAFVIDLANYRGSNKKTIKSWNGVNGSSFQRLTQHDTVYDRTSAVSSLQFFAQDGGNFDTYSRISIYGLK